MNVTSRVVVGLTLGLALAGWLSLARFSDAMDDASLRGRTDLQFARGNVKDAYDGYRRLALDAATASDKVGGDLRRAIECLHTLGRSDEADALREAVVAAHRDDWRVLQAVAESYLDDPEHFGFIVAGVFHRGWGHNGRYVGSYERDRARAIQLLLQGLERARTDPDRPASGRYFLALARTILGDRSQAASWRLQSLTPLDVLTDLDESGYGHWGQPQAGAPALADGTPVYYKVPESFARATSDGERWRWALAQAVAQDPGTLNTTRLALAGFLLEQFGTQTIAGTGDAPPVADGPYALDTLTDDETIARLATGVRRFKLPEEFNFIRIYQALADGPKSPEAQQALDTLAQIYENRRQFDQAADYLKRSRDTYGENAFTKTAHIKQILEPWGQFVAMPVSPAGQGATVEFRYRNGHRVHFEAHEILYEKLLQDARNYIASATVPFDWQRLDINNVGERLVVQDQKQYLGRGVASWDLDLDPLPHHFDRKISVTTPLQKAGAYLLTARMEDGHTSSIVVWLDDTVLIEKSMAGQAYYFVADSRTGQPVPGADLAFFGYRLVQVPNRNEYRVETRSLVARADGNGQVLIPTRTLNGTGQMFQWVVTASTPDGRRAHQGFSYVWGLDRPLGTPPIPPKVYGITDRPVYRPGGPVRFKFWVANANYGQPDASPFAGRTFRAEVYNPKHEKVQTTDHKADAYGGFDGTFEIPSDAALGVYQILLPRMGAVSFRVEEYKKPEFEVAVEAPSAPSMLGDKIVATIKASYYFGGPVTKAKVKYKVSRTTADARWYPVGRWDWLFGRGYWWFAPDAAWYPGWSSWGVLRPILGWEWGHETPPPEVVAEAELPIGPDGTVRVEIDTALARATHPDHDQRYEITAEVTDASRRTITGSGTVLAARKPFAVYTWTDRGYYRVGDTIEAGLRAATLDQNPVAGKGTLRLLRIQYDAARRPVETPVESWDIQLDTGGQATRSIKPGRAGQYRLAATIDDGKGHVIEGGYLVTVNGPAFDGADLRFGDLEVIPDRKEYHPGETLRLMINTDRVNPTVLLFVRAENGVYQPPTVFRPRGKSMLVELGIAPTDMPNLFVEAMTITDGKVHNVVREIAVPPESRMLNLAVEPSAGTYKPGEKARVKVKLTGTDGQPFRGSSVLAVYDKAVEAIAGGSNVPDIKAAFWGWKRHHAPQTTSSLDRWSYNVVAQNEVPMQDLGVFGWVDAEREMAEQTAVTRRGSRSNAMMGGVMAKSKAPARGDRNSAMGAPMAAAPAAPTDGVAIGGFEPVSADSFDGPHGGPQVEPVVRKNFADTAFWLAALETGPDGTAEVAFDLPESLTTWKLKGWAMGAGTRVGQSEAEVVTTKNLLVRLQAPRFFVERDEVVLSAIVHNKLKSAKPVQVLLETDGGVLRPLDATARSIAINAGAEQRVDWRVQVVGEGRAVVRMKALTDEESDATQMEFPAYVHGMLRTESYSGAIRPDRETASLTLRVPAERRPEQTRLEVRYSPTLAGALVDALPYLADYPYACTEQTLNRFLPTVITRKVLIDLGLDLKAIQTRITNLNAQEIGKARDRAKTSWQGYRHNPVFDEALVARMERAGLQRLVDMQLSDGGWGWFSGYGEFASAHTTALVVHGLQTARRHGSTVPPGVLERGLDRLKIEQARQVQLIENATGHATPAKDSADDTDALVFMVLADADSRNERMLRYLDRDRTKLSVYGKALLGLGLERLGEKAKLAVVLENISQFVVRDDENQTAFLKLPNEHCWWFWYGSNLETHAFYLKLLARTDPRGEVAPRLVKYLVNNRSHGSYWSSTRDTAFCIESLAEYLKASGEDQPEMTIAIAVDGKDRKQVQITPADLFAFDNALVLEGDALATGEHTVTITRRGRGPVYFNAYLTTFTTADPIPRAGLEVKVDRKVYRLVRDDKNVDVEGGHGQAVGQRVERYRREPLDDGASLRSGELVEVELEIDSKNDYEYLVFEDFKAAGFEPVEVQSGYNGNDLNAYVEFRDERVAFFARSLSRGKHSVAYRLRAEIPGRFHALPARASAMYAPELRGNSDEIRLQVAD